MFYCLNLAEMYNQNVEQIEFDARELNMRELNGKQACKLAFIVSNKVHIVTIITSDISDVIILININVLIQ